MIEIKKYTWDRNIKNKKALDDPEVFVRILNYANVNEIKILIKKIGIKKIKNFILKNFYKLNKKSLSFWKVICGIRRDNPTTEKNIRTSFKLSHNR